MPHRHRLVVVALSAAFASLCFTPPASAAKVDGTWSMVAVTTKGHCGVVPIGLRIKRGRLQATSGWFAFYPIKVSGRVAPRGQVRLKAVAGPRIAHGTGRFGKFQGKGTWKGRGPSGLCSGYWNASRY